MRRITNALAHLSRCVEINASLNLTDINLVAENFYRDLLNLVFGYNLININSINPNAKAIDLGDSTNRIAIQVTSTSALKKTTDTVNGFIEKNHHKDYDRLIVLNLVKKSKHKASHVGDSGVFELDTAKDIWDYKDLARKISDKTVAELEIIADFLESSLELYSKEKAPKEVETFMAMIELLSVDTHPQAGKGYIEEPDPERKIYKRFSDYSDFLTGIYIESFKIYGNILKEIIEGSDIGTVQVEKIGHYLKEYSDKVLTECSGDPKEALEKLVNHFSQILGAKEVEYDAGAVKFYLVDQLIRCNVFPNTDAINA